MHKVLRKKAGGKVRTPVNIKFFKDFVKRLLVPSKRRCAADRSVVFFVLFISTPLFAAFEDTNTSVQSEGLAGAAVARAMGAESIFTNPSAILTDDASIDAYLLFTKPFNIAELNMGAAAAQLSRKRYAVGGGITYFGNSIYRENQLALAAALRATSSLAVGLDVRYATLAIKNYGQAGSLVIDFGSIARLHKNVSWGFALKNVNYAAIGRGREQLPQILSSGISVKAASHFLLSAELYKDARFPVDARFGLEYLPFKILSLRFGTALEPSRIGAGFSLAFSHFRIDYAFKSHVDLGATHLFAINFFK